jgi:predicted ATPase
VLKAAPGVRVIAASREPPSMPGEHVIRVPPLELAAAHADEPAAQLRQDETVRLFTDRAAAASGAFERQEVVIHGRELDAIHSPHRHLQGLTLADVP